MAFEIIGFFFGLFYLITNFAWNIKSKAKPNIQPDWKEMDVKELEAEQNRYYFDLDKKLADIGFSFFKLTFHQNWNAKSIQRIYISSLEPSVFTLIESWSGSLPKRRVFSWKTRLSDGTLLITGAPRSTANLFRPLPTHKTQSFWESKEPKDLWEIHKKRLASENKSTERIYPEKFPQEILDEWNSFIQWRLKCGDFEYSKNKDHFIYSWAFAFKNVLVIVNPFGRSMGSPTQFVRIICAGLFFYSVPFFSSKIQLGLMPNWIFRDLTLFNEIYKFLAFYIGGLFLRTLSGKSIVAAYVLAFVPLVWVFKTNLVAGFASLLFLLSGIARQKTPSGNAI